MVGDLRLYDRSPIRWGKGSETGDPGEQQPAEQPALPCGLPTPRSPFFRFSLPVAAHGRNCVDRWWKQAQLVLFAWREGFEALLFLPLGREGDRCFASISIQQFCSVIRAFYFEKAFCGKQLNEGFLASLSRSPFFRNKQCSGKFVNIKLFWGWTPELLGQLLNQKASSGTLVI